MVRRVYKPLYKFCEIEPYGSHCTCIVHKVAGRIVDSLVGDSEVDVATGVEAVLDTDFGIVEHVMMVVGDDFHFFIGWGRGIVVGHLRSRV